MSLIAFHRFLIGSGIVFCFGFAGWELLTWWVARRPGALILGVTFVVLGGLLVFYLSRLRSFLGYEEGDAEGPPRREVRRSGPDR